MKHEERNKYLKWIQEARLIDNAFMHAFFDHSKQAVEFILRIILDDKKLKVTDSRVVTLLVNPGWREVILDILAIDGNGNNINVEIQRSNEGANVKRARYHSAMLDTHMLQKNHRFEDIKDSYVIFITEEDVFGRGLPIRRIERVFTDTGEQINDGGHIIYVNGANQNSATELGRLMHDFFCKDPDEMHYQLLAKRARSLKKGDKNVESYCDKWDRENKEEKAIEIAKNLIIRGKDTMEEIAEVTGIPVEKIYELARDRAV